MSNKRINIDNLQEYNKQMQEAYIKPLADKLDGLNIQNGAAEGSTVTANTIYTGEDITYSDGSIGLNSGSVVPGGLATGFGATALGGMRFGYSDFGSVITLADGITYRIQYEPENYYLYKLNDKNEWDYVWGEKPGPTYIYGEIGETIIINGYTYTLKNSGRHHPDPNINIWNAEPYGMAEDGLPFGSGNQANRDENDFCYPVIGAIFTTTIDGVEKEFTSSYCYGRTPTSAEGNQSFAAGASVHAVGDFSVALGKDTAAYQGASMVIGGGNRVGMTKEEFESKFGVGGKDNNGKTYEQSFSFGFAAGSDNKVLGYGSVALGGGNNITGEWTVAGGANNTASGSTSVVFGIKNNSSGQYSATFGEKNTNNAYLGNVFGSENTNNAYVGTIFGAANTATGAYSFTNGTFITNAYKGAAAFGNNLTTSRDYQVVFGQYNKDNGEAFLIVGKGASNNSRSNAFEITSSGINLNGGPISFTDNTFYFKNNINGSRYTSLWVNDVSFIPKHNVAADGKDNGSYRALSTIFSYDETTGTLKINW